MHNDQFDLLQFIKILRENILVLATFVFLSVIASLPLVLSDKSYKVKLYISPKENILFKYGFEQQNFTNLFALYKSSLFTDNILENSLRKLNDNSSANLSNIPKNSFLNNSSIVIEGITNNPSEWLQTIINVDISTNLQVRNLIQEFIEASYEAFLENSLLEIDSIIEKNKYELLNYIEEYEKTLILLEDELEIADSLNITIQNAPARVLDHRNSYLNGKEVLEIRSTQIKNKLTKLKAQYESKSYTESYQISRIRDSISRSEKILEKQIKQMQLIKFSELHDGKFGVQQIDNTYKIIFMSIFSGFFFGIFYIFIRNFKYLTSK